MSGNVKFIIETEASMMAVKTDLKQVRYKFL